MIAAQEDQQEHQSSDAAAGMVTQPYRNATRHPTCKRIILCMMRGYSGHDASSCSLQQCVVLSAGSAQRRHLGVQEFITPSACLGTVRMRYNVMILTLESSGLDGVDCSQVKIMYSTALPRWLHRLPFAVCRAS